MEITPYFKPGFCFSKTGVIRGEAIEYVPAGKRISPIFKRIGDLEFRKQKKWVEIGKTDRYIIRTYDGAIMVAECARWHLRDMSSSNIEIEPVTRVRRFLRIPGGEDESSGMALSVVRGQA